MIAHNRFYLSGVSGILMFFAIASCGEKTPQPQHHTVEIVGMKFVPENLTVNKGDTVTWINKDIVAHDVTEKPNNSWKSPALQKGEQWSKIIDSSDNYFCSIHVVMQGKITLQSTSTANYAD